MAVGGVLPAVVVVSVGGGGLEASPRVRRLVFASVSGSGDRGRWPGGLLGVGGAAAGGQPVAAGSVSSFSNAALSASVHGQAAGRCSLPRRPENASRAATCNSR